MATVYRKVANLSAIEAAYLAGLIDGEGTIALTRRHRNDERQLVVSISNTERPLLDWVLDVVGAGTITKKRTYRDHHSIGLTYTVNNRQALALLEQIAPHLRTYKTERAQLVLSEYVRLTPRNGRYTLQMKEKRIAFIEEFLSIRSNNSSR